MFRSEQAIIHILARDVNVNNNNNVIGVVFFLQLVQLYRLLFNVK